MMNPLVHTELDTYQRRLIKENIPVDPAADKQVNRDSVVSARSRKYEGKDTDSNGGIDG
jgi:hypothetical protein